jgi:hypothetical protein
MPAQEFERLLYSFGTSTGVLPNCAKKNSPTVALSPWPADTISPSEGEFHARDHQH